MVAASIIATEAGKSLSGVSVAVAAATAPAGVSFPFGVLSYNNTSDPGASVEISLTFSTELPANMQLYKVDRVGKFVQLPDTIWQQMDASSLKLMLTDGDPVTDLDAAADGVIEDPLAIGSVTASSNAGGGVFDLRLLLNTIAVNGLPL